MKVMKIGKSAILKVSQENYIGYFPAGDKYEIIEQRMQYLITGDDGNRIWVSQDELNIKE
ncbi:hypothetical protein SAMN04487895_101684 [Paenibacillus sophorae]|uniref:Uncharacterized protein n=1 Tax=Paenibacillus sophorae TaxID=1333845 RepID=A0A1H8GXQ4_9BACL|nr:hypothetical protein [Paenibacillus sophorae]QWU14378.1 hypothetical protein KP014_20950 [Paenibacillus sophorae]SEN48852.1 hypothetical protein SAMN04487895_101684 [Paenibacillus sophorae]